MREVQGEWKGRIAGEKEHNPQQMVLTRLVETGVTTNYIR